MTSGFDGDRYCCLLGGVAGAAAAAVEAGSYKVSRFSGPRDHITRAGGNKM
jgi:hypothetical protein